MRPRNLSSSITIATRPRSNTSSKSAGRTRTVYRKGSGPAVIVLAEMPGITPLVASFARKVAQIGCTPVMPHLFGTPGKDPLAGNRLDTLGYVLSSFAPICISREFTVWATNRTSPVIEWLRALAAAEHQRCGGPGVGAIGMCFTGGFALAMATDPSVLAPVLSQPSLPFATTSSKGHSIDCSPADLATVRKRCDTEGLGGTGARSGTRPVSPEAAHDLRVQARLTRWEGARSTPAGSRLARPGASGAG